MVGSLYASYYYRPIIMKHLIRFHGIAQTDVKLKCRVHKTVQGPREARKIEHASTPPTLEQVSAPPTPLEAAPSPSPVVKISHRRKPSQESQQVVTLPQNTEASAPHTPTTLNTDELPLTEKKPAAKKRSHRRKAGANDAPLKKRKQQQEKTNF